MTEQQLLYILPIAIPLFFVAMWIGVTTLIGFMSGWFTLMQQFPDRDEKPLAQLNWQSGFMGPVGVNYRNVLKIGVCPSGLRVGVLRVFGLFAHDFFVPWHAIKATKKEFWMWQVTELSFGKPEVGRLLLYGSTAGRIAETAKGWPQIATVFKEPKR
jgi:hypothetical protein